MATPEVRGFADNVKYHVASDRTHSTEKGFKWSDCCKYPVGNALLWTITTIILVVAFAFEGMTAFAIGVGGWLGASVIVYAGYSLKNRCSKEEVPKSSVRKAEQASKRRMPRPTTVHSREGVIYTPRTPKTITSLRDPAPASTPVPYSPKVTQTPYNNKPTTAFNSLASSPAIATNSRKVPDWIKGSDQLPSLPTGDTENLFTTTNVNLQKFMNGDTGALDRRKALVELARVFGVWRGEQLSLIENITSIFYEILQCIQTEFVHSNSAEKGTLVLGFVRLSALFHLNHCRDSNEQTQLQILGFAQQALNIPKQILIKAEDQINLLYYQGIILYSHYRYTEKVSRALPYLEEVVRFTDPINFSTEVIKDKQQLAYPSQGIILYQNACYYIAHIKYETKKYTEALTLLNNLDQSDPNVHALRGLIASKNPSIGQPADHFTKARVLQKRSSFITLSPDKLVIVNKHLAPTKET